MPSGSSSIVLAVPFKRTMSLETANLILSASFTFPLKRAKLPLIFVPLAKLIDFSAAETKSSPAKAIPSSPVAAKPDCPST